MARVLVRCPNPSCRRRHPAARSHCKGVERKTGEKIGCGKNLKNLPARDYWIEFSVNGRKQLRRIGLNTNKGAAEAELLRIQSALVDDRYIEKSRNSVVTLRELREWYLALPEIANKEPARWAVMNKGRKNALQILESKFEATEWMDRKGRGEYIERRDAKNLYNLKHTLQLCEDFFGGDKLVKDLTAGNIAEYNKARLTAGRKAAATNRPIAFLNSALNTAARYGYIDANPLGNVKLLAENNKRQWIITTDEFQTLLGECPPFLRPVVLMAYLMGMRKAEIIGLTWQEVDLDEGVIILPDYRTKTNEGRTIPIHPKIEEVLRGLPSRFKKGKARVFVGKSGAPINDPKAAYAAAIRRAGLHHKKYGWFTFHDLRRQAINNLRLAGNDFFRIMALSGHKTMSVFKRYNVVGKKENMIWLDVEAKGKEPSQA